MLIYFVKKSRSLFVKIFSPFTLKIWPYFQKKFSRLLLCDSERSCYLSDSPMLNFYRSKNAFLTPSLHPLLYRLPCAILSQFAALPPRGSGEGVATIALLVATKALLVETISLLISPIPLSFFPMSLLVFTKIGCRKKWIKPWKKRDCFRFFQNGRFSAECGFRSSRASKTAQNLCKNYICFYSFFREKEKSETRIYLP